MKRIVDFFKKKKNNPKFLHLQKNAFFICAVNCSNTKMQTKTFAEIVSKPVKFDFLESMMNRKIYTVSNLIFTCGVLMIFDDKSRGVFHGFGVRVSMIFHFMFVHYTFSSVWVA